MDISYGILDYNPNSDPKAFELLTRCARSLHTASDRGFRSEVFLINQGNRNPDYVSELTDLCHSLGFHYVALNDNVGISRGINYLAQMGRGNILSLLTSDVEVQPGTDQQLVAEFEADPRLWQITPTANVSSIRYQTPDSNMGGEPLKCIATELTLQFWRRDAFEEIGFFDERWKACYENLDWTMRLFLAGYDSAVSRKCECFHHHNTTSKNGAINQAYDGYLQMEGGLDHGVLRKLWNQKWPGLDWNFMYNPGRLNASIRQTMRDQYEDNLYLPFVQDVGY